MDKKRDGTSPKEALQRIVADFDEFCRCVDRFRRADGFRPEDCKAAYEAFYRVRERYDKEKKNLTACQRAPLDNVFWQNVFTKGAIEIRQVSQHIVRTEPFQLF